MQRARSAFGWKALAAAGGLVLSACLFGGDQDSPLFQGLELSGSAPRPGWYKGDYGELAQFGLESELILTDSGGRTSLQFIGIEWGFALMRVRGDYSATDSSMTMVDRAESNPSYAPSFDAWHSGIFDNWAGLSDTVVFPILVFRDGSFARYESVVEFFDVDTDSIPVVVQQSPRMWVRYRPAAVEPIATGRFEYREFMPFGSDSLPAFYRDLDFRGCDTAGKFVSRAYSLIQESRIAWFPPVDEAWGGYELETTQWSRLGSFLVLRNFRERIISEFGGPLPWIGSSGEYLLRVIPHAGNTLMLWWNYPGFWTEFRNDTASCATPPPSAGSPAL